MIWNYSMLIPEHVKWSLSLTLNFVLGYLVNLHCYDYSLGLIVIHHSMCKIEIKQSHAAVLTPKRPLRKLRLLPSNLIFTNAQPTPIELGVFLELKRGENFANSMSL